MTPQGDSQDNVRRTNWLVVFLVLVGVAISLLPVALHLSFTSNPIMGETFAYLPAILTAVLFCVLVRPPGKKEKIDALLLSLVFALVTTYVHVWMVDLGQYLPGTANINWQISLQNSVIGLDPDVLPHSYRVLPNSIVRLFEQLTTFSFARDAYRNLFVMLFFYTFYRFARLFLRHGGSLLCLALLAAILPVSFRDYAGQLTDPMSHLSFVLAFIFLETEQFVYLLLTVTIGCLAKETVAAMAGYYLFSRWREKHYVWKAALLVFAPVVVCEIARFKVLHGFPTYRLISGMGFEHPLANWREWPRWLPGLVYTSCIFVPFVIAGWRNSPRTVRSLTIYWFPVLIVSGFLFSWLRETRNFVPLAALLIALTVCYLLPGERVDSDATTGQVPDEA